MSETLLQAGHGDRITWHWLSVKGGRGYIRDQNGFLFIKWALNNTSFCRGVWGSSPRNFLTSGVHSSVILGSFTPIPPPYPFKKILTLRMVMAKKRSKIRLKSENFDLCIYICCYRHSYRSKHFKKTRAVLFKNTPALNLECFGNTFSNTSHVAKLGEITGKLEF